VNDDTELQRDVTVIALRALERWSFALAGSGAIREPGLVDRLTRDIDLFTNEMDPAVCDVAVDHLLSELRRAGLLVEEMRRSERFVQLCVATSGGRSVDVDLAVD
jgi:hypothetical protein